MATQRASGVYVTIIDESYQALDTSSLGLIVPMMLKKGATDGLITVTYDTLEEKVGYDLIYNPLYYGLKALLESFDQVKVLRLNVNPYFGNVVFNADNVFHGASITSPDALTLVTPTETQTVDATGGYGTPVTATLTPHPLEPETLTLYNGATLIAHDDGEGALVADGGSGVVGTINYTSGLLTLTAGPSVSILASWSLVPDFQMYFAMESAGDWEDLAIEIEKKTYDQDFALAASISLGVLTEALSLEIRNGSGTLLATETPEGTIAPEGGQTLSGTVTRTATNTTLALSNLPASGILNIAWVLGGIHEYNVTTLRVVSTGVYSELVTEEFNLTSTSADYLNAKTFTYIQGYSEVTEIPAAFLGVKHLLTGGGDGTSPNSTQLDLNRIDGASENFVCTNGIVDATILSKFSEKVDQLGTMFMLSDTPNYSTYEALYTWSLGLRASENYEVTWVSDEVTTEVGKITLFPSVNVAKAYAKMFKDTGYIYYPFAGYDFGAITAESLITTDAALYADQLKTNKINYQKVGRNGPVIWEQRTRYGAESDLTYANSVLIVKGVSSAIKSYMENFGFKFITPSMLTLIDSGLDTLLSGFQSNGFLWSYTIAVPTYDEVIEEGTRIVTIPITIQTAKDGEVFDIQLKVSATAVS